MSEKKYLINILVLLVSLLSYSAVNAQSLPSVGLVLHYDAQDIDGDRDFADQPSNGSTVSTWTNQSTSDDAIASGGNEPTFDANGINANGAISFDGTNDLFTIANSTDLNTETQTDEISIAIVLETGANVTGEQIIYEQGGGLRGYSFALQNSHIYAGVWNNTEWDASHQYKSVDLGVVSPNTIYFITIVQNSSSGVDATNTLSIYLNGNLASSVNHVDPQRAHSGGIGFGRINNNTVLPADNVEGTTANTDYYIGLIGEFLVWKSALSQTDITDLNTYFLNRWSIETPPTIDLNGLVSNGQDYDTQFSQGSTPVNISNSGAADISDIESTYLSEMEFKIANLSDGTDEVISINGVDIILSTNSVVNIPVNNGLPILRSTVTAGTGGDAGKQILVLQALDIGDVVIDLSVADGETILRAITFENQASSVTTGIRSIEITATDSDANESAIVTSDINVIVGAPDVDLNGPVLAGGNYPTAYTNLTTENIAASISTVTAANNVQSLELFLDVLDLNLENFNINGTAIDISNNTTTLITADTNLNVTVTEVTTGLNAGKQSVLIEPVTSFSAGDMQTLLRAITYEHLAGTFSTDDRIIGVVITDTNSLSTSQFNSTLDIAAPPVNNVPGAQSTDATTALAITNITCSDIDGNLNSVELVTSALGDLDITISGSAVLSGNGVDTLIITGTELDINASLASLIYTSVITLGSETLKVTATDLLSAQDVDEVIISINPPPTFGLVLHYDGQDIDGDGDFADQPTDGAAVTTWTNQSSSADATATGGLEPTYSVNGINSEGAINFDGTTDLFTIANSIELNEETETQEISLAIVLKTGASVAGEQIIYEQGGGSRGYSFVIQNSHIHAGIWNNIEWDAGHQYKSVDLGIVAINTVYFITIVQKSSTGSDATNTLSIYLNGTLASSINHVDPQNGHGGGIGLGRINGGTVLPADTVSGSTANTDYFQGLIGEFMIWKSALSQSEITELNTYFLDRWSIQTPPTLDLNGLATNGQDFGTPFSEGGIPVNITNSGAATLSDLESTDLLSMNFKIDSIGDGTSERFNINGVDIVLATNSIVTIPANNSLPILRSTVTAGSGADVNKQLLLLEAVNGSNVVIDLPVADGQKILRAITYENQAGTVTQRVRTIEITATDAESNMSTAANSEIDVIAGAPILDLNGPIPSAGDYSSNYTNLTTENVSDATATITAVNNVKSLELFLDVQDVNLENFNISGTAIDIANNTTTLITATTDLNVTVSEVTSGYNAEKQSVLIEPVTALTATAMQTILRTITFEHLAGTFSTSDRVIGFIATDTNSLSSTQVNTTLTAIDSYVWTGTTDTDWSTATNWDNNITPPASANVVIPSAVTLPILDQNRTVNNLTINNSTLDLNTFNINTEGNLTIITSTISNGEFLFTGSSRQDISVNGTLTIANITVNNSSGVELILGSIGLSNTLTLTSGDLITNNGLTLISNASGTARISEITGGSIVGNITMQRYIGGGATNWRFFSPAVSGASVADYNDDFITSGFIGSDFPDVSFSSISLYDETVSGTVDLGFVLATNVTNAIAVGEGIWAWSGDSLGGTSAFTVDVTGPVNTGNINLPISYTNTGSADDDGWNMVGNPYPSTIDWDDNVSITKSGVHDAVYIWNPNLEQYGSYVGGLGLNGGSRYIASSQGFWVQANASSPSVQLTESCKTADASTFLKQNSVLPLRIKTQTPYGGDELIINFNDNATTSFDGFYDAKKLNSSKYYVPNISSVTNIIDFSINQMNPQEIDIPIRLVTGYTEMNTISFENVETFSDASCLVLEDLFTGISYELFDTTSFTVLISDTTKMARFILHIGASSELITEDISCFEQNDAQLIFNTNSTNPFDIVWKDSLNNVLSSTSGLTNADTLSNLASGAYVVESTNSLCGTTIDTVIVIQPQEITAQFSANQDTVYLPNSATVEFTNQSTNAVTYFWDFDDLTSSSLASPSHQFTLAGTYNVTLTAAQDSNCFKQSSSTIVVIEELLTAIDLTHNKQNLEKIWINNNQLIVEGNDINLIEVKNTLGQTILQTTKKVTNLSTLSSQVLFVTVLTNTNHSTSKVNFIKK